MPKRLVTTIVQMSLAASLALVPLTPAAAGSPDLPALDPEGRPVEVDPGAAEAAALRDAGFTVLSLGPEPQAESQDGESAAAVAIEAGQYADVGAVGDLDGDGSNDVLAVVHDDPAHRLVALAGSDGRQLWSADIPGSVGWLIALGADVTGDGIPDLVETRFEASFEDETCAECPEGTTFLHTVTAHYTLRAGGTGDALWTLPRQNVTHLAGPIDDGTTRRWYRDEQVESLLGVVDGHLVMAMASSRRETVETRETGVTFSGPPPAQEEVYLHDVNGRRTVDAEMTIRHHDGRTGEVVLANSFELPQHGLSFARPLDIDGDGTLEATFKTSGLVEDTWHCIETTVAPYCDNPRSGEFETGFDMIDLATGQRLWGLTIPGLIVSIEPVADVDGDGSTDFVIDGRSYADDRSRLISGADGSELWAVGPGERLVGTGSREGVGYVVLEIPEHDEDTRTLAEQLIDPSGGPTRGVLHVIRRDGASGAELWRTSHDYEGSGGYTRQGGPTGDFDGDGVQDAWLEWLFYGTAEVDGEQQVVVSDTIRHVESGATGEVLYELPERPEDGWFSSLPDLDGDGGDDWYVRDGGNGLNIVRSGRDGAVLWQQPLGPIPVAGDLDGLPGAELLETDGCDVVVSSGRDRREVWRATVCVSAAAG